MKFAFSTVSCPKWDFDTIVARAITYGYTGIEVRGFLNESALTASNPFLTDPHKLRDLFADNGLEICCLASSIAMTQNRKRDKIAATELTQFIDTAHALNCKLVKVFDTQVRAGQDRPTAGVALGNWILPLADYAAERDVILVIENALSFRAAKEMWSILDRLQHPSIACCWDVFNAAMAGESPYISVPTLNSKIQYTQVKDAKLGQLGASYTKLGDGDVQVETFVRRLRGIGYKGWVTLEWEKAWLPNIAEPEEVLPHAITKLLEWSRSGEEVDATASDSEPAAAAGAAVA